MKTNEEKEEFYTVCGMILGIDHEYKTPVPRRNRWNTRRLGNGRYEGFGLIHCYGSVIRVISRQEGAKLFYTYDDVYKYLKILVDKQNK